MQPPFDICEKVVQRAGLAGEGIGPLFAIFMDMIAFPGLIVVTQYTYLIDDQCKAVLEAMSASSDRQWNRP